MTCKNCGNSINNDTLFCPVCGAPITSKAQVEMSEPCVEEGESAPHCDSSVKDAAIDAIKDDNNALQGEASRLENGVKSPKKLPIKLITAAIAVMLVAVLIFCNFDFLKGAYIKSFSSPEEYLIYAETKSLKDYFEIINNGYNIQNFSAEPSAEKTKLTFKISENAINTYAPVLGFDSATNDLDWLKEITLNANSSMFENKKSMLFDLLICGQKIASGEYITDGKKDTQYIKLNEISDKYFIPEEQQNTSFINRWDLLERYSTESNMLDSQGNPLEEDGSRYLSYVYSYIIENIHEFSDLLPDEDEMNDFCFRYVDVIMDCIKSEYVSEALDVKNLTVDGITEDCKAINLEINEKLVNEIGIAVISTLKNDEYAIRIIKGIETRIKEIRPELQMDFYEDYSKSANSALDKLNQKKNELSGSGSVYFTLTDYINSSHEVIGRRLVADDGTEFSLLKAESNSNIAYELSTHKGGITFKGTKNGDKLNGDAKLLIEKNEVVSCTVGDFVLNKNEFSGDLKIKIGKDIGKVDSRFSTLTLLDIALELKINAVKDKALSDVSFAIVSSSDRMAELIVSTDKGEYKEIRIPDDNQLSENLPQTDDLGTITENLKKAGLSEDVIYKIMEVIA